MNKHPNLNWLTLSQFQVDKSVKNPTLLIYPLSTTKFPVQILAEIEIVPDCEKSEADIQSALETYSNEISKPKD